jgi:creatinine amidohydrolase/Fe(II)-dependent formamide hydrolase-like protein
MRADRIRPPHLAPLAPSLAAALLLAGAAQAPAQTPGRAPAQAASRAAAAPSASRSIEELTWTEVRDALKAGATTVIVPIGGTEQNGPHMVMGKHNYIVTFAANEMARRLGNTLVAPTIQYVPEGDYNAPDFGEKPGVISNPSPSYDDLLDAAARSLKVHGFTEILFIGDSGGNQNGMTAVADKLNQEWGGSGAKVYALTDYYRKGQEHTRAWLQAQYGWDMATIGTHAGITDTSQMLYVFPSGIRKERRKPGGGSPEAGVSGDPTKATPEIGKMAIEFKVNAGIAQYRALKAPPRGRERGAGGS